MHRAYAAGVLRSIVTTQVHPEVVDMMQVLGHQWQVPVAIVSKNDYKAKLKDILQATAADAAFVLTFPWRIPEDVLGIPRLGFFNFHHGRLPEMRGADPVFECVRQGMAEAGSCVHMMSAAFDAGPIVLQQAVPFTPDFTYGMLSGRMAEAGAQMCDQLIRMIKEDTLPGPVPQDESKAVYWPRIGAADLRIDWRQMSWQQIKALVKACNPLLRGVPTSINGWQIGLTDVCEVAIQGDASHIAPGTVLAADPQNGLVVCCQDGKALRIEVIYAEEGTMAGFRLQQWGIAPGAVFT